MKKYYGFIKKLSIFLLVACAVFGAISLILPVKTLFKLPSQIIEYRSTKKQIHELNQYKDAIEAGHDLTKNRMEVWEEVKHGLVTYGAIKYGQKGYDRICNMIEESAKELEIIYNDKKEPDNIIIMHEVSSKRDHMLGLLHMRDTYLATLLNENMVQEMNPILMQSNESDLDYHYRQIEEIDYIILRRYDGLIDMRYDMFRELAKKIAERKNRSFYISSRSSVRYLRSHPVTRGIIKDKLTGGFSRNNQL